MASRRQPLIPGWLWPGASAALLMVAVALAAFSALWFNAPSFGGAGFWQDNANMKENKLWKRKAWILEKEF